MTKGLLVTNNKQGAALAKVLGDGPVALMRGHGNIVVARDIPRVVHRALYTEVNAQQLAIALSFRRPIKYISRTSRTRSGSAIPGMSGSRGDGGRRLSPAAIVRHARGSGHRKRFRSTTTGCRLAGIPSHTIANASISTMNSGRDSRAT